MSRTAPNILWVVTTQWRARAFAHAGDPNARTPGIDRLTRQAVRFSTAVTPHPFGPFARAALLTGVPSPANGIVDYFDPLPRDARTIAHDLGERGYRTAWFGKWHLGRRDPAVPLVGEAHARVIVPVASRGGFAHWEGFESGFLLNDPWLHGSSRPEPVRFPGYQSDVLCSRADAWMNQHGGDAGEPWFCVVSLEPPHPPYDAPAPAPRLDPASVVLDPNVPCGGDVEERARRELAGYYAHIAATDRAISTLVDSVRTRAAATADRPTYVVITSVHGDMHGAHGQFRKGWPYEESVAVPLIVLKLPDPEAGSVESRPVSLLDLPAMALRWADGGVWAPGGRPASISMPSVVRLPHQCDRAWHGWRAERWKLVMAEGETRPWLVFDLAADPWERENLAGTVRAEPILRAAGMFG